MDWKEAKESTLGLWVGIRDSIGTAEPLDLLVEINAICDLCEMAKTEARGRPGMCRYCPAYEQFGGCREVSGRMSELVAGKDWDQLRSLVDEFLVNLRTMEVPQGAEPVAAAVAPGTNRRL